MVSRVAIACGVAEIRMRPLASTGGRSDSPAVSTKQSWLTRLGGKFLVFDGPDGSGKTSQLRRFLETADVSGLTVCAVREPGGTAIGERIRDVLLDPAHTEMDVVAEMLLYMASRAQLLSERIRPALTRGELVVADRFVSSTLAYQGTAGGIAASDIREVARIVCGATVPDLTIIFDVDEETAAARLAGGAKFEKNFGPTQMSLFHDRMENKSSDFHRRVREGYLAQAREEPQRHLVVDASGDVDSVFAALLRQLQEWPER